MSVGSALGQFFSGEKIIQKTANLFPRVPNSRFEAPSSQLSNHDFFPKDPSPHQILMNTRTLTLLSCATLGALLLAACDEQKPTLAVPTKPTISVQAEPKLVTLQVAPPPLPALPASLSATSSEKLSAPLLKALQMAQVKPVAGEALPKFPDIPIQHDGSVLVDLETTVSKELLEQITKLGGRTSPNPEPGKQLRVFIPPAQLEALAAREDVTAIAVATVITTGGMQLMTETPTPMPDADQ
jgi:hypothetical protein